MAKEWCVEGLSLKFSINGTDITESGIAVISSTPSEHVKVNGHGVYSGVFKGTFSGSTYNGYVQTSPAEFSITCGAQYSKDDNKAIMLIEDTQTVGPIPFQLGQSSTSYYIKCEVQDAGQTYIKEL